MDVMETLRSLSTVQFVASTAVAAVGLGAAAGMATEWILAKVKERKDDEIEARKEAVIEHLEQEPMKKLEVIDMRGGDTDGDKVLITPDSIRKPDISTMVDYTKYWEAGELGGSVEVDGEEEVDTSMFEVISEEEFVKGTGNGDYVSVVGTYFPLDGVLAGWNDKLEPRDISRTVGHKALEPLEEGTRGSVYVRNDHEKVLYEIVLGIGTYEDAVTDIDLETV